MALGASVDPEDLSLSSCVAKRASGPLGSLMPTWHVARTQVDPQAVVPQAWHVGGTQGWLTGADVQKGLHKLECQSRSGKDYVK